jgi:pheromone a factor receptor
MFVGIKNLNPNRHLRLMGLAGTELMLGIPCSVYICLYLNISSNGSAESPINPYINWDNVHLEFSRVDQFPAVEWKQNPDAILNLELARWSNVVCAFIFFGWFGFAQEARKNYRLAFDYVTKKVGSLTAIHSGLSNSSASKQPMTSTNCGTIPFFISRQATFKPSFPVDIRPEGVGSTLDYIKRPHSHADSASGSSRSICEKSASITAPPDTFDAASPFH